MEYPLERLMLKLKLQYLGHLTNSQLIGKDPDSGKYLRQKEKWVAEVEIVRQHHQLNGHEFKQIPEDNRGQRSLACYTA